MTRPPADDYRDLARRGLGGANDTTRDPDHAVAVDIQETFEQILGESGGIVVQARHFADSSASTGRRRVGRELT
jgi:hypothetical protein